MTVLSFDFASLRSERTGGLGCLWAQSLGKREWHPGATDGNTPQRSSKRMTDKAPDQATVRSLYRRATEQVEQRQWEAAQASLQVLRAATPEDPRVALDLAAVMQARGLLRGSTAVLLDAAKSESCAPELLLALARKLYFTGELVTARSCLDRVEAAMLRAAPQLVELARMRWLLGEHREAYKLSTRALASGADSTDASYLHATLAQYNGEIEVARTSLLHCLEKWPRFGEAAVSLVHLERQESAELLKLLDARLARLQNDPPGPMQQQAAAQFHAARFKVLDDLGHFDEAWQALERGNAIMQALHPYDESGEAAICEALVHTSASLADRVTPSATLHHGPQPIFVVSLPRSGTTLLDRALSNHSAIMSAGEINDFRRQLRWMTDVPANGVAGMLEVLRRVQSVDLAELGRRYLAQTQWRAPGKRWFVDKLPINIRMVPFIRLALPGAVIVHIHRAPMDVCYSNLKAAMGPSSAYSFGMTSMAHYYGLYRGLVERWQRDYPGLMHEVAYEELLRAPVSTLTGVLGRCGLKIEPACLHPERNAAPVATPSCNQVREAPHLRSLGEWRRYESRLEPLRASLNV